MLNKNQFSIEDQDVHDPHRYTPAPHYPERGLTDFGPNMQGKLLKEERYLHGYGPQRSKRVHDALRKMERPGINISVEEDREVGRGVEHALKRSTIPAEHIASLGGIDVYTDKPHEPLTQAAQYHPGWEQVSMNATAGMGESHLGEQTEHTLAHEIGHHIGYQINPNEASESVGAREAHADVYAARHARVGYAPNLQYTREQVEHVARHRAESTYEASMQYLQHLQRHDVEPHSSFYPMHEAAIERTKNDVLNAIPPDQRYTQGRLF